jgi:hypothetical protein
MSTNKINFLIDIVPVEIFTMVLSSGSTPSKEDAESAILLGSFA